jgi:hypothetical protein
LRRFARLVDIVGCGRGAAEFKRSPVSLHQPDDPQQLHQQDSNGSTNAL